jgi:hypothetical protein
MAVCSLTGLPALVLPKKKLYRLPPRASLGLSRALNIPCSIPMDITLLIMGMKKAPIELGALNR